MDQHCCGNALCQVQGSSCGATHSVEVCLPTQLVAAGSQADHSDGLAGGGAQFHALCVLLTLKLTRLHAQALLV